MIGTKLYKDNTEDMERYSDVAVWCNANNAHIEEVGDYYEVVENTIPEPTLEDMRNSLDNEYNAAIKELQNTMSLAMLRNDEELIKELKEEYICIQEEYINQLSELENMGAE